MNTRMFSKVAAMLVLCGFAWTSMAATTMEQKPTAATAPAVGVHPRLLFAAKDIPALRAKMNTPVGAAIWERLKAFADATLKEPVPLWDKIAKRQPTKKGFESVGPRPNMVFMEYTGYRLWGLSMAYVLSDDKKYGDAAKQWLLAGVRSGAEPAEVPRCQIFSRALTCQC